MAKYYVNQTAQPNGGHEVHQIGCGWLVLTTHKKYLGEFDHCKAAVAEAKKNYGQVNGCFYCCEECGG
jgi:hypothetical protein